MSRLFCSILLITLAVVRGVIRAGDLSHRPVALYRNGISIILRPDSTSSTFGIGVFDISLCR